jgi:hypothetical protein
MSSFQNKHLEELQKLKINKGKTSGTPKSVSLAQSVMFRQANTEDFNRLRNSVEVGKSTIGGGRFSKEKTKTLEQITAVLADDAEFQAQFINDDIRKKIEA